MHIVLLIIFLAFSAGERETAIYPGISDSDCNCLVQSDTLFVTNNLDEGEGSLRCALECAALTGGKEIIDFDLAEGQDSLISLKSSLPVISANTWIINKSGQITIDGAELGNNGDYGFRLDGDSIIISGLFIRNFPNNAIDNYSGHDNVVIENNVIYNNGRLSPSGDGLDFRFSSSVIIRNNQIFSNGKDGVYLQSCENVYLIENEFSNNGSNGVNIFNGRNIDLGDSCEDCGNTIIGNGENGVRATFNSSGITLLNNYIGIRASQVPPIPNLGHGVYLSNCDTVQIGLPGAGNYISANALSGIFTTDSTSHVMIQNNRIGYSTVDGIGMPNGQTGIELRNTFYVLIGGDSTIFANDIGFQPNHVLVADSSQYCSIKSNEYFCSISGINLEQGANMNVQAPTDFQIISSNSVGGTTTEFAHIQAYLRNTECNPCQGNTFLGSVVTAGGEWVLAFDHTLEEGDEVSLIKTDEAGNTSQFSVCIMYSCEDFEVNIVPVDQNFICQNGTLTLGTDTGSSFVWSTGENTPEIVISEGGEYSVMVLNEMDCPSYDTIYIPTYASPDLELLPADSTVFCEEDLLLKAFGQGSFKWNTGQQGPIIMVDSSGYYCVSLTNQFNCVTEKCVSITKGEKVIPELSVEGDTTFCEGESTQLVASGGMNYEWNYNDLSTPEISVFDGGTYTVTITNEYGCEDSISQEVIVNPGVNAYILPTGYQIICPGDSIKLTAYGGDEYLWDNNDTSNSIVVHDWGNYTVTVTNEYGCDDVSSKSVSVKPPIEAHISVEGATELCAPDSVWLTITYDKMDSIRWNTGDTGDSLLVKTTGTYVAEIFNLGCSIIDSAEIVVHPAAHQIDSISGPSWAYVDSIQIFSIPEPVDGTIYEWEVDGGLILSTTNTELEVQWTDDGIGLICVVAIDSNLCASETYCKIIDLAPLGIQSLQTTDVIIYPNPASGVLNLELNTTETNKSMSLEFYSPNGLLVSKKKILLSEGANSEKIDVSDIPGGIYWVKIQLANKGTIFEKILLNH